jgi:hypothetical protein
MALLLVLLLLVASFLLLLLLLLVRMIFDVLVEVQIVGAGARFGIPFGFLTAAPRDGRFFDSFSFCCCCCCS